MLVAELLVPSRTGKWREVPRAERSLAGVSALECVTPAEEAQAIALILREALDTPDRTAALVTLKSVIGAERILDRLSGEQLPRIC